MRTRPLLSIKSLVRGVAAVEFALLLTPLVLMIFGTTELGRAIYSYNTLDKTVRDAARYLSQNAPGNAAIATQAKCLAVNGTTDCSGSPIAPGLTTAMITICDAVSCPATHAITVAGVGSVHFVTVSVQNYAYNSMVEFVIPDMTFNNISATMRGPL